MPLGATLDRRENVRDPGHLVLGEVAQPRVFQGREQVSLTGALVMEGHELPVRGPADIELDVVSARRGGLPVGLHRAALRTRRMASVRGYPHRAHGHRTTWF